MGWLGSWVVLCVMLPSSYAIIFPAFNRVHALAWVPPEVFVHAGNCASGVWGWWPPRWVLFILGLDLIFFFLNFSPLYPGGVLRDVGLLRFGLIGLRCVSLFYYGPIPIIHNSVTSASS